MSFFRSRPSTGPQTFLERLQQGKLVPKDRQIKLDERVDLAMLWHLEKQKQYTVYHMWCKAIPTSDHYFRFWPHHSQIFIRDRLTGQEVVNFGVAPVKGFATLVQDGVASKMLSTGRGEIVNGYILSQSYKPNPVIVDGQTMSLAFKKARSLTGDKYHLLLNNCQKFARIFMQECGSMHYRHPLHP